MGKGFSVKLINLVLYSNLFIALCSLASLLTTKYIVLGTIEISPFEGLIFFATLLIYALHRIVGILRLKPFEGKGRYRVIAAYRSHISIYAIIAAIGCLLCTIQLPFSTLILFLIPTFISVAYIVPLYKGKRLRDFNFIKIFLIALVWAIVTVWIPLKHYHQDIEYLGILFFEKAFFILAITLPFDWRDVEVDKHLNVKTIPNSIGLDKTLGLILLIFLIKNVCIAFFLPSFFTGFLIGDVVSGVIIYNEMKKQKDIYYTLGVDGTMIIQLLVLLAMFKL